MTIAVRHTFVSEIVDEGEPGIVGPEDWNDDHVVTGIEISDVASLQASLDEKAPLASPAFTGNPTAPTPTLGDNDTSVATTGFVKAAIDVVLGGVSAAFDTLAEIATAIGLKADKATTLTAGAGLTGGGDISASRSFAVGAGTGITVNADDVALDTSDTHNVDHSGVTLTAGAGLTGGGTIAANRSFAVGAGTGIVVNADDVAADFASQAEAIAGTSAAKVMSPLRTRQAVVDFLPQLYASEYGISPSNTAAQNSTGLAALTTAIGTGGVTVIFDAGKFQFNSTWHLTSLTCVTIRGQGGTDLTYSGNFGTVLHFTGTGSGAIIDMSDHRGVVFEDLQLVYSSNSCTGIGFYAPTSFSTGCGSDWRNVQCYQITNTGHTLGEWFYLLNNVDISFDNVHLSHADYGWLGQFDADVGETNVVRLTNCTAIGLNLAAIVNPKAGWVCDGCNFELSNTSAPCGILATGSHSVTNLTLTGCVFADSSAAGTWINLPVSVFGFTMIGGGLLTNSVGTGTGIVLGAVGKAVDGIVIAGVVFSGLATGIDLEVAGVIGVVIGNNFLNTTTALANGSNFHASSIVLANNGLTSRAIAVPSGGTGLASGTSGGLLYFDSSTTLASSGALTANRLLKGGGAGAAPIASGVTLDSSNNVSGFGTVDATNNLTVTKSQATLTKITVINTNTDTAAAATFELDSNSGTFQLTAANNPNTAGAAGVSWTGSGGLAFIATAGPIIFETASFVERIRVDDTRTTMAQPIKLKSYTVAGLPAGSTGDTAYCSNARVFATAADVGTGTLQGAAGGTGSPVTYNGSNWVLPTTNITAVA